MPSPSPTDLSARLDALLANRIQHLVPRTARDILSCIDRAVQRWLEPHSPERQEAEARLPETTGLSAAMIRHVLPLIFREYRADRIEALCVDELGCLEVLDRFVPSTSGQKCASGPPLILHALAGNVPGAGLDSVIFSLLVKSATLVKTSSAEPVLPVLFAPFDSGHRPKPGRMSQRRFLGLGETQSLKTRRTDGPTWLLRPARMRAWRQSGNERADSSSATDTR